MPFKCSPAYKNPVETLCHRPWELAVRPFQVSPQTYYVSGQKWVGAYLIDTGEGLILLDTGIAESVYLLLDSIYQLGYQPSDIKMILISHAHLDHFGGAAALKALTGAPLYMSREDERFMRECPEETELPHDLWHVQHIEVDRFFDDDVPICLGNISIRTMLTPGHTVGCTSFFWKEKNPVNGQTYTVAMHGGVGSNTMNDRYYETSAYLKPALRTRFLEDAGKLKSIHVDIALPSHPNQIEILDRAGTYTHETQPYLDDTVWADFIEERVRQVRVLMK
ncbi:MAG: MBL fold metallo-hydrolase [Lachnospiraceae bacterium]|nr:MBL fold metallo-hydrolase [Lachnospiraceae bacterium]